LDKLAAEVPTLISIDMGATAKTMQIIEQAKCLFITD
jgi:hypothetical protein